MGFSRIIIDIIPLSLLVILLYGAAMVKPLSSFQDGYLSISTTHSYRGFFAILIVLYHFTSGLGSGLFFPHLAKIGYLPVAYFFFLSGYGLQKSYLTKQEDYRNGFLLRRLPSLLIPYIITIGIYWLVYLLKGEFYSLRDVIYTFIEGNPIVNFSWYIIDILLFYCIFWVLMTICHKHYLWMIIGAVVWYFLYAYLCVRLYNSGRYWYSGWWYYTTQLLIVGMIWATYEKRILEFLKNFYVLVAPLTWCIFLFLFIYHDVIILNLIQIPFISHITTGLAAIFFVLSVLLISQKIQIGNRALGFLGEISLEIYMMHGLFLDLFKSGPIVIENEFLCCICVLSCTIIFSFLLHKLFQFILGKYKLLLHRANV